MFSSVNCNAFPVTAPLLPLSEDKLQIAETEDFTIEVEKKPSDRLELIEKLFSDVQLPLMQKHNLPFIKSSRRNYDLENSIIAFPNGDIFEQYHRKDIQGHSIAGMEKKGLQGEGATKKVWELKPLHGNTKMARASFESHIICDAVLFNDLNERLERIKKFKNEIDSDLFLLPDYLVYKATNGQKKILQTMPLAEGGDLEKLKEAELLSNTKLLSYLGRLRVIRRLLLALIEMHERGWAHFDVKPANILLMNKDPDNPISKLGDLDDAAKIGWNDAFHKGSPLYMDPKCLNLQARGFEDARVHDQFSFGMTAYALLVGKTPRESFESVLDLLPWVTEDDLKENPGFDELPKKMQDIIRKCSVGPADQRKYRLPEFLEDIEEMIEELSPSSIEDEDGSTTEEETFDSSQICQFTWTP